MLDKIHNFGSAYPDQEMTNIPVTDNATPNMILSVIFSLRKIKLKKVAEIAAEAIKMTTTLAGLPYWYAIVSKKNSTKIPKKEHNAIMLHILNGEELLKSLSTNCCRCFSFGIRFSNTNTNIQAIAVFKKAMSLLFRLLCINKILIIPMVALIAEAVRANIAPKYFFDFFILISTF